MTDNSTNPRDNNMVLRSTPRFARSSPPSGADELDSPLYRATDRERFSYRRVAGRTYREARVRSWLIEDHGLTPQEASATVHRLLGAAPKIRGAFLKWWLTGEVPQLTVEGYDLAELRSRRSMTTLGALLTLSLLACDPEHTTEELERTSSGDLNMERALELADQL